MPAGSYSADVLWMLATISSTASAMPLRISVLPGNMNVRRSGFESDSRPRRRCLQQVARRIVQGRGHPVRRCRGESGPCQGGCRQGGAGIPLVRNEISAVLHLHFERLWCPPGAGITDVNNAMALKITDGLRQLRRVCLTGMPERGEQRRSSLGDVIYEIAPDCTEMRGPLRHATMRRSVPGGGGGRRCRSS